MADRHAQKLEAKRCQDTVMKDDGIYRDGKKIRGGSYTKVAQTKYNAKWAPPKPEPKRTRRPKKVEAVEPQPTPRSFFTRGTTVEE